MSQLEMFRGDSPTFEIKATLDREPSSLAGLSVRFTARRRLSDDRPVISLSDGNGIALDLLVVGRAVISIPSEATARFTRETLLYWDVQIADGVGSVETVATGTLLVMMDATH